MTQATPDLHPRSPKLNRRRLLGGAAALAAAGTSTAAVAAQPAVSLFAPSPLGIEFQAAVADFLRWCPRDPESGCPEAFHDTAEGRAQFETGYRAAWSRRRELTERIWQQPLSPSNLVDRALVVRTWRLDDDNLADYLPGASKPAELSGADEHGPDNALMAAVLQLAGLSLDAPAEGIV